MDEEKDEKRERRIKTRFTSGIFHIIVLNTDSGCITNWSR
jgi:hypothetical protein